MVIKAERLELGLPIASRLIARRSTLFSKSSVAEAMSPEAAPGNPALVSGESPGASAQDGVPPSAGVITAVAA